MATTMTDYYRGDCYGYYYNYYRGDYFYDCCCGCDYDNDCYYDYDHLCCWVSFSFVFFYLPIIFILLSPTFRWLFISSLSFIYLYLFFSSLPFAAFALSFSLCKCYILSSLINAFVLVCYVSCLSSVSAIVSFILLLFIFIIFCFIFIRSLVLTGLS